MGVGGGIWWVGGGGSGGRPGNKLCRLSMQAFLTAPLCYCALGLGINDTLKL